MPSSGQAARLKKNVDNVTSQFSSKNNEDVAALKNTYFNEFDSLCMCDIN